MHCKILSFYLCYWDACSFTYIGRVARAGCLEKAEQLAYKWIFLKKVRSKKVLECRLE